MEKEILNVNMAQLEKEVRLMELKGLSMDAVKRELDRCEGARFSVGFESEVGRLLVKGRVFFALNESTGRYGIEYYELSLPDSASALHPEYAFPCEPWLVIRLDEAVNLMRGRYIYRKPEIGAGFWIGLTALRVMPSEGFVFIRSDFEVREYLAETGMGGWLGLSGWVKLVDQLDRGHRCDLAVGVGSEMRVVKVEADPLARRLKVMDRKGKEVDYISNS